MRVKSIGAEIRTTFSWAKAPVVQIDGAAIPAAALATKLRLVIFIGVSSLVAAGPYRCAWRKGHTKR